MLFHKVEDVGYALLDDVPGIETRSWKERVGSATMMVVKSVSVTRRMLNNWPYDTRTTQTLSNMPVVKSGLDAYGPSNHSLREFLTLRWGCVQLNFSGMSQATHRGVVHDFRSFKGGA